MSLVMGAAPAGAETVDEKRQTKAMVDYDISLIAASPFGATRAGAQIVKLLRSLNKRGDVQYGKTIEGGRGEWDGTTILMNEEFRGQMFPTTIELVHEGSHAVWRQSHPKQATEEGRREDHIADELLAQENQLAFYEYLKATKGCPEIALLELRLTRQANGTLRQTIAQRYESANPEPESSP